MSMAGEMAQSAVQNGKCHHTAACRALEHHLSKRKHIMKPYTSELRSSRVAFSTSPNKRFPTAAILPSSGADNSSVEKYIAIDKEECEEWAADVVGRAELDRQSSIKTLRRPSRQRALSITSPESSSYSNSSTNSESSPPLSCSPVGFWHVAPGEGKEENDVNEPKWPIQTSQRDSPMMKITIKRSQSYSDFSCNILSPSSSTVSDTFISPCSSMGEEGELYRMYYLKFINLLITRETHVKQLHM